LRGYKCGVGEEINNDGSGYIGNWEYDEKQGKGRLVMANGDIYMG